MELGHWSHSPKNIRLQRGSEGGRERDLLCAINRSSQAHCGYMLLLLIPDAGVSGFGSEEAC